MWHFMRLLLVVVDFVVIVVEFVVVIIVVVVVNVIVVTIQGVSKYFGHLRKLNFSASEAPRIKILNIFRKPC